MEKLILGAVAVLAGVVAMIGAPSVAMATSTYTFTTIGNPDNGTFLTPNGSGTASSNQGSMQIQWTYDGTTATLLTGSNETYANFGANCSGGTCAKWTVDTNQTNTVTVSVSSVQIDIFLTNGSLTYRLTGTMEPAGWLGTNGESFAAQFHGSGSQWIGASGFLTHSP